jgi:SAM-dependent methyltransferase
MCQKDIGEFMIEGVPQAVKYLYNTYDFLEVVDLGCGKGQYHKLFPSNVKIHAVDNFKRIESEKLPNVTYHNMNLFDYNPDRKFDCVMSSHVIEHIPNLDDYIDKHFSLLKDDGVFCILFPKPKGQIVGGHVHIYNMGLILYNLVRNGIDCSKAKMVAKGHTLGVMSQYKKFDLPVLKSNRYDIDLLSKYFPFNAKHAFDGARIKGIVNL